MPEILVWVTLVLLVPVGYVGFTMYCLIFQRKAPREVLGRWQEERQAVSLEQEGRSVMRSILSACPDGLPGWNILPCRNDLAAHGYSPRRDTLLQYHFRRPDGSDNLRLDVVVNPPTRGLPFHLANPLIPDGARVMALPQRSRGWIHEAYPWKHYLPEYDRKRPEVQGCMAQIYLGNWRVEPRTSEQQASDLAEARNLRARILEDMRLNHASILRGVRGRLVRIVDPKCKLHRELVGPTGRIDPNRIPLEMLPPEVTVPATYRAIPASGPSPLGNSAKPHCIALQIVGRDEGSVMDLLRRINLKRLLGALHTNE